MTKESLYVDARGLDAEGRPESLRYRAITRGFEWG